MAKAKVPEEFAVPFGKARVRREGTDLTIVAYGTPVHFALEAAKVLAKEGRSVEVIDLRSLVPLDWETVLASVRKTSRVLVAHEDKVHGGFGGEIAAQIQERAFASLDAPVGRVGSEFTPVGFSRILERAILPSTTRCSRRRGRCWRTEGAVSRKPIRRVPPSAVCPPPYDRRHGRRHRSGDTIQVMNDTARFDPNLPVRDLLARYPQLSSALAAHGLDSCCGGEHPLEDACAAKGVDARGGARGTSSRPGRRSRPTASCRRRCRSAR